jgi:hypothetical protein
MGVTVLLRDALMSDEEGTVTLALREVSEK